VSRLGLWRVPGQKAKIKAKSDTLGSATMSENYTYHNATYPPVSAGMTAFQPNPALIKLYQAHGLRSDDVDTIALEERTELCEEVSRFIETSARPIDREMATDILVALLRHAEKNLKQAISERFAVMDDAPLRLALQFVNDEIAIAEPMLRYSKALNDLDLLYIIQSRDSPFWQAIAARKELSESVVDALADTRDVATAKVLVENISVELTDYAAAIAADLAKDNSELADSILARSEMTKDLARILYTYVGEELQQHLSSKAQAAVKDVVQEVVADVIGEFTEPAQSPFMPTAAMIKAADLFMEQGKLSKTLMINTLKRGQMASFIAQFSRYASMPVALVIPMLQQRNGQGLAIACRATDVSRNEFITFFSFTRKVSGQSHATNYDLTTAISYYDRITPELARRLMLQAKN